MFSSFICGGSFHEQDLEEDGPVSCGSSPRSIKKSRMRRDSLLRRCSSDKGRSKNPYSRVGLDKFSALLSDLEERKKNIYLQRDSQDIMFVRFVYSGSEEVVPVVVKSRDRKKREQLSTTTLKAAYKKGQESRWRTQNEDDSGNEHDDTGEAIVLRPDIPSCDPPPADDIREVVRYPLHVHRVVLCSYTKREDWQKNIYISTGYHKEVFR